MKAWFRLKKRGIDPEKFMAYICSKVIDNGMYLGLFRKFWIKCIKCQTIVILCTNYSRNPHTIHPNDIFKRNTCSYIHIRKIFTPKFPDSILILSQQVTKRFSLHCSKAVLPQKMHPFYNSPNSSALPHFFHSIQRHTKLWN